MTDGLQNNPGSAVNWFTHAIDVIERGRTIWKDVPKDDRGAVFEATFLRGIKVLRLDSYLHVRLNYHAYLVYCFLPRLMRRV